MAKKRNRGRAHHRANSTQAQTAQVNQTPAAPEVEIMPALNMGFHDAAIITAPKHTYVQFVVAGGGGIGAYMVQHLGRLQHVLYQMGTKVHMTICDPDVVTEQNIGRQLFCKAEIGMPKAEALMRRYGQAWGLDVSSYIGKFDESIVINAGLTLVVGCVDGADGRQALHKVLQNNPIIVDADNQPNFWWLDCGNANNTGRVLLGTAYTEEQVKGAFPNNKICIALPSPGLQSPGLLEPEPEELPDNQMSCAELAAANLQSLNINARIAAEAADMVTRLLVTDDLKRFACEVNLAAGVVRSYYATPEEVACSIHRTASFLDETVDPTVLGGYSPDSGIDVILANLLGL